MKRSCHFKLQIAIWRAFRSLFRLQAALRLVISGDFSISCCNEKARLTRARRRGKLLLSLKFAVSHFYFVTDFVLGRFVIRERA